MNPYEMTFIVRPDLDDEHTRGVVDQVTNRITSTGGEIIAVFPWSPARRRMAYPIRDFGDGVYVTTTFQYDPQQLREFENALKLNDRILRFLVVQATEQMIRLSQQRMQQQTAAASAPPQPAPGAPQAPGVVPGAPQAQPAPTPQAVPEAVPVPQAAPVPPPAAPAPEPEPVATVPTAAVETEE